MSRLRDAIRLMHDATNVDLDDAFRFVANILSLPLVAFTIVYSSLVTIAVGLVMLVAFAGCGPFWMVGLWRKNRALDARNTLLVGEIVRLRIEFGVPHGPMPGEDSYAAPLPFPDGPEQGGIGSSEGL